MKLRNRHKLSRREVKRLREEAEIPLSEVDDLEVGEMEDGTILYLSGGNTILARRGDTLFPTLRSPILSSLPSIIVDMGAIPHICNGADVMAPGVVDVEGDFEAGELVVVRDERHGKALAIGKALVNSNELRSLRRGRVVENLHHVGDRIWRSG